MKGDQCYELFGGIALKNHAFFIFTGTTTATFSSFEKVSQSTMKECNHNSAPLSCDHDPIPSKHLI